MRSRLPRIHLSTALLMMFVAAGILWLNLRSRRTEPTETQSAESLHWLLIDDRGWPFTCYFVCSDQPLSFHEISVDPSGHAVGYFTTNSEIGSGDIVANIVVAVLILGFTALAGEKLIHWKRRSGYPYPGPEVAR